MSVQSMRARLARLLLLACAMSPAVFAQTAVTPPPGTLTLARALDAALRGNPELHASAYELNAAQARAVQAALRPNPELVLELENFAGAGSARGTDALETTLSLSQVVELGGRRGLRRAAAALDVDAVGSEQAVRELDVLAEVTRRFIEVAVAQEHARFAVEAHEITRQTADSIESRARAGRTPQAEVSRARVAEARAAIEREQASVEFTAARQALSVLWGEEAPSFDAVEARLFDLPAIEPLEPMLARIESSGDLARFATLARQREAEWRLAQAQARPNLTFSLGVRRFEATRDHALVAGVSMPLAIGDRNQGSIAEARVRMQQNRAEHASARLRARATVRSLHLELGATRSRIGALGGVAIPRATEALEQTRAGYDRGRFSFLELASVQEELLSLRAATIDAAADYHRLLAEIERLTGAAATPQPPESQP